MHQTGRFSRRRMCCLAGVLLGLAACSGNNSGGPGATTLPPIGTGGIFNTDTTAPLAATATTAPAPGSSIDSAAPVNDPNFALDIEFDDSMGSTVPIGLVELARNESSTDPGRCFALLGTYSGLQAASLVTPLSVMARAELITDADPATGDERVACDRSPLDNAGWGTRPGARLLAGADYHFATAFFVPEQRDLRGIRLFADKTEDQRFFVADILGSAPPLPPARTGRSPVNLRAADVNEKDPFNIGDEYQSLSTTIRGVIPGLARTDGRPGSCAVVIGTIKPTKTIGAILNALAIPSVSLIADGVALEPTPNRCASRPIGAQGWAQLQFAGVAPGNTFAFAQSYAVGTDEPILQAISVGDIYDAKHRELITAQLLADTPKAPQRERLNPKLWLRPIVDEVSTPVGDGTPSSVPPQTSPPTTAPPTTAPGTAGVTSVAGTGPTEPPTTAPATTEPAPTQPATTAPEVNSYTVSGSPVITIVNEAVWNAQAYGVVGLPSNAESATCYAILLTWSVSKGAPTDPPPVGLISAGAYWAPGETEARCDTTPLTNAGWQDATLADFNDVDDAAMHVFVPIFIPTRFDNFAAIGVGNVADDENVGYVAPVRIAAPPGIPGIVPVTSPPSTQPQQTQPNGTPSPSEPPPSSTSTPAG